MVIIATIQTIKEEQQFIMPVFDFSNSKTEKKDPECTYTTFQSNEKVPSPEKPILIIDNKSRQWKHHSINSAELLNAIPPVPHRNSPHHGHRLVSFLYIARQNPKITVIYRYAMIAFPS